MALDRCCKGACRPKVSWMSDPDGIGGVEVQSTRSFRISLEFFFLLVRDSETCLEQRDQLLMYSRKGIHWLGVVHWALRTGL